MKNLKKMHTPVANPGNPLSREYFSNRFLSWFISYIVYRSCTNEHMYDLKSTFIEGPVQT